MNIPQIENALATTEAQIHSLQKAIADLNENLNELRGQLGVERPPQPIAKDPSPYAPNCAGAPLDRVRY